MRLTLAALLLTTACATEPPTLCDREAQEWNKFDTAEDQCARTATERHPTRPPVVKRPAPSPDPEPPISEPPVDEPEVDKPKRQKGNNGWGNGDQDPPGNSGPHNNAENWEW